jgi:hypothetical protein
MDKKIVSRLFIERDNNDDHEIVIRIGPFEQEDQALHSASYIYITQNIDLSETIRPIDETLH